VTLADGLSVAAAVAAAALAGLRWMRVAQREHYLSGSVTRFAWRWWVAWRPLNRLVGAVAVAGAAVAAAVPVAAVATALALAVGPLGLSLRGRRPGPLAWTRRLRTLAAVWAVLHLGVVGIGVAAGAGPFVAAVAALLTPLFIDAALALTAPLEARLARPYVERASRLLRSIRPTVVAVTGSYGKTSTKGYIAHLVSGTRSVLATPRSFNNRAGLARAVNEQLAPGTDVFVAEMGAYGPGEIAELCTWIRPRIGVITAIGPVHLERFKSEERIVEAKAEVFTGVETAVLNVDDPRLEELAYRVRSSGARVLRCGTTEGTGLDVQVVREGGSLVVAAGGVELARVRGVDAPAANVACAVAVARELGVPDADIVRRLPTLPVVEHRLSSVKAGNGCSIIDDTYNSNPAGSRLALSALGREAGNGGRAVVVTPGMVELGPRQAQENATFAATAADVVTDLVVVGHTNRAALMAGARAAARPVEVVLVEDREKAAAWVREHLGPGDVVLYENDLPDHFA